MELDRLSQAIVAHPQKVLAVFCGFDLWLALYASGHVAMAAMKPGGVWADGSEPEGTITAPLPVIGDRILVSLDPTIPPDQFYLKP